MLVGLLSIDTTSFLFENDILLSVIKDISISVWLDNLRLADGINPVVDNINLFETLFELNFGISNQSTTKSFCNCCFPVLPM